MMNIEKEIFELLDFIKDEMQEMDLNATKVFLNGNCGNLYKILVKKFPKSTIPFLISNKNIPYHIVTKINNKFYDITGETDLKKYIEYLRKANNKEYKEEDFEIKQLSVADELLNKMCDMYEYNEDYEQSEIENEMKKLLYKIEKRETGER